MKTIIVFLNGEVLKYVTYRTKLEAKRQLASFKKHGILGGYMGELIVGAEFELV